MFEGRDEFVRNGDFLRSFFRRLGQVEVEAGESDEDGEAHGEVEVVGEGDERGVCEDDDPEVDDADAEEVTADEG